MLMLISAAAGIAGEPKVISAHNTTFRMNIIEFPVGVVLAAIIGLPSGQSVRWRTQDVNVSYPDIIPWRYCFISALTHRESWRIGGRCACTVTAFRPHAHAPFAH